MIGLFADFAVEVNRSFPLLCSVALVPRRNHPCVGLLWLGKNKQSCNGTAYGLKLHIKHRYLSNSFCFALYFCRHYWIRYVPSLLSSSGIDERRRNRICDLYRIILSIANEVNVPCCSFEHDMTFRCSPLAHIWTHEIICKRLTLSISSLSGERFRSRLFLIFYAWLSM